MYELLRQNIESKISISEAEWQIIIDKTEIIKLKKSEFLQIQDSNSKYEAFVVKGLFKIYISNEDGSENVFSFAFEEDWIYDIESFYHQKPCKYSIRALEDCEIIAINRANKLALFKEVPQLVQFYILMLENNSILFQERLLDTLNKTSKQRYIDFVKKYPSKTHKINNKNLSSYLGVSHEFLSKIKKSF